MGCLLVIFTLLTPRFVILILWFSDYLEQAYGSWFWPTLGFFFMPVTTIAYAVAKNDLSTPTGGITASGVVVIVIGVVLDFGLIGNGWRRRSAS